MAGFETQPGYLLSATPGKKLIWWLPDNSAPGLTAASVNHAEYQRRALPVKRET
ncbi:transposase [Escherichia coli]|nr:transposase [Escherichia coli]KIG25634.1 transposase [Escherichia coli C691-71 (14b)]AWO24374.1 transposase [Escherichia coli]AYY93190.1 transposase [Escherichia coli]EAC1481901.1 transposase [Escherichia coli]